MDIIVNMRICSAIKKLITRDTRYENESAKMPVLMRILSLTLTGFFLINAVAFFIHGTLPAVYGNIVLAVLYFCVFLLSYRINKIATVWLFIIVTTIWAMTLLWFFGPDSSFQIFPPFVIIIFFFASYNCFLMKVIFGFITFIVYQGMSFLYGNRTPFLELTPGAHHCVRDSCMFIIILCTCIAAHMFSKDSQNMERKLIEYNKRLKTRANTDPLTGLNNRGMAMEYLQDFVRKADTMICCLCICDIDHFKRVNDSYGHDIGDRVLKNVAKALKETIGDSGFVARWGGEEFFIAFPECNGDEAMDILYRVQKAIRKTEVTVREETVKVTLTYGLTEYDKGKSLDDNIKDADNNLYLGKERGRNTIVF